MPTIPTNPEFVHMAIERMKTHRPKATQVRGIRRKNQPNTPRPKTGCHIDKRKQHDLRSRQGGNLLPMKGPLTWKGNELTEEMYVHYLTPEQIQECEKSMQDFKSTYHKCMNVMIEVSDI